MSQICRETLAPYMAEGMHEQAMWRGRLLVLAELNHPDIHNPGLFALHGMAKWHKEPFWEVLFGFWEFPLSDEIWGPDRFLQYLQWWRLPKWHLRRHHLRHGHSHQWSSGEIF